MKFNINVLLIILILLFAGCNKNNFSGENAYLYISKQLEFGPRIPGSTNSQEFQSYLIGVLEEKGWEIETQFFQYKSINLGNIIAKNSNNPPKIILGTHYDTRKYSDQESDALKRNLPVPGANDGASGTAILLELASKLNNHKQDIWLVFFDAEDQGNIAGWEWSIGAQKFVDSLECSPDAVVIIDMVADDDLIIYKEKNSSTHITNQLWEIAARLGYDDIFKDEEKYSIIDDHLPFINKGINAALIIDMDYPYWHTNSDILENTSPDSLEIVGSVLLDYINSFTPND